VTLPLREDAEKEHCNIAITYFVLQEMCRLQNQPMDLMEWRYSEDDFERFGIGSLVNTMNAHYCCAEKEMALNETRQGAQFGAGIDKIKIQVVPWSNSFRRKALNEAVPSEKGSINQTEQSEQDIDFVVSSNWDANNFPCRAVQRQPSQGQNDI